MDNPSVRPVGPEDFDGWLALWRGYHDFYRSDLPEEVTTSTFSRLCRGQDGFFGLVAAKDGDLVGLAHAVFHPATWSKSGYCYMEDLYVAKGARGGGVARSLIEGIYAEADRRGAESVYWHTQAYNSSARSLYDQVGRPTSFVVYER